MMEKIDLALKAIYDDKGISHNGYDLTREPYIVEMMERVENGEDVFVKFPEKDRKRPGAIAKVRKFEGHPPDSGWSRYRPGVSSYQVHLKWDGRKNTAKVDLNEGRYGSQLIYLRGYTGETVWSMFDPKKHTAKPVYDRLGRKIEIGNTVIYINARYGSGAELDFGVVKELKHKAFKNYKGDVEINSAVIIETIAINENERVEISKIKRSKQSIIVINDIDLLDKAFVAKLSIDQKK